MFSLMVLPHRGKELEKVIERNKDYFVVTHGKFYSVIRENPYNKLKGVSHSSILDTLQYKTLSQLTEPCVIESPGVFSRFTVRTITEDLGIKTECLDCYTKPSVNWEEQSNRYKALLLIKITG